MLNRRSFIAVAAALGISGFELRRVLAGDEVIDGGWHSMPGANLAYVATDPKVLASEHTRPVRGAGKGKIVRLWKAWEQAAGKDFEPHLQELGDCTSQAAGLGIEVVNSVQVLQEKPEKWCGKQSTEVPYISSRIDISNSKLGNRDGSTVAWVAKALQELGSLPRGKYPDFDVTNYRPDLAKNLSRRNGPGLSAAVKKLAIKHKLRAVLIDGGWPQACDVIASGHPVIVGSNRGFNTYTDSDGFLTPFKVWMHAMLLCGIDTASWRHGGCFAQSWGYDWIAGPKHKFGVVPGGFWAEAQIIDRMLRQGDSWALISYDGLKKLDYQL